MALLLSSKRNCVHAEHTIRCNSKPLVLFSYILLPSSKPSNTSGLLPGLPTRTWTKIRGLPGRSVLWGDIEGHNERIVCDLEEVVLYIAKLLKANWLRGAAEHQVSFFHEYGVCASVAVSTSCKAILAR